MILFTILFLVLFIGCFIGALIGSIIDNQALSIGCAVGVFGVVFLFILIDKLIKKIKSKNVKKLGKPITAKVIGASFGGRKEINIGSNKSETFYFFPIFFTEDIFGIKTYYNAINMISGEDLKKLTSKGEVKITVYKNYCVIDEDLSEINFSGSVPYLGKDMTLDENGWWQAKKLNVKESKKQKNQTHTIYKVAITFLSIVSVLVSGGAIALIVYGVVSRQYSLIIGAVVAIGFVIFSDVKLLFRMVNVLRVDKLGTKTYARSFNTQVVEYHSTNSGSSTNYVVTFTFYDENDELQKGEEYVLDNVYFRIQNLDRLPIKVYKKHGAIDQEALYR